MTIGTADLKAVEAMCANKGLANKMSEIIDRAVDAPYSATFSVGAESSNAIVVDITIKGAGNSTLTTPVVFDAFLVSNISTNALNTNDYTVAAGASGGVVVQLVADQVIRCITTAAGLCKVSLTITGAASTFIAVNLGGRLFYSPVVTHA